VDCFHTGYGLDSLKHYVDATGDGEFRPSLERGLAFFKERFVEPDGRPRSYATRAYPVDIQCAAQAIDTLALFADDDPECLGLSARVAAWTVANMQDPRSGSFHYRKYPLVTARTPMLHWGQATMFKALAHLALRLGEAGPPDGRGAGEAEALAGRGAGEVEALAGRGPGEAEALAGRGAGDAEARAGRRAGETRAFGGRGASHAEALAGGPAGEGGRTLYQRLKPALDRLGSLTLLIGLAPAFLVIALLVKLTSAGPVFYGQVRLGRLMKPFTMWKFRTMHSDADHALHREFVARYIRSDAPEGVSGNGGIFKLTDDPRVTPLGRFLRRTSLDELPQLWNVLRGDMSLVGPRPPLPYEVEHYKPRHRLRVLEAKPGVTGLWQVAGRSRTTFEEMVELDLQYARTCSFLTDLRILLATPAAVVSGRGAW
jgi:lipopolysaccharide/colanic/teichoic acid biosynthesis glycosyltransferase